MAVCFRLVQPSLSQKQNKLVNKRITTMTMELEVKEMATRQRLREFKEKLKQFKNNDTSLLQGTKANDQEDCQVEDIENDDSPDIRNGIESAVEWDNSRVPLLTEKGLVHNVSSNASSSDLQRPSKMQNTDNDFPTMTLEQNCT